MNRRKALVVMGKKQNPLLNGLIGYWKLDQTSGNRLSSVGNYHLGVQGTVGYTTGLIGNCATMATGAANYLLLFPGDDTLKSYNWSAGFTVAGWLYVPTAFAANCSVLAKDVGGTADWRLQLNGMNGSGFYIADSVSGTSIATDTSVLNVDAWYFFAGRYNPSTKKAEFKLNVGPTKLGNALTNNPANAQNRLAINRYSGAYGTCRYDEVGLWIRYLSDAELTQLYNSGAGLSYPF